jgi:heat shock protein HslJ
VKNIFYILCLLVLVESCKSAKKITRTAAPVAKVETTDKMRIDARKWKDGIDFYAVGNESDWSVDIDQQNEIRFSTKDGDKLIFFKNDVNWLSDMEYSFTASDEAVEFSFNAREQECSESIPAKQFAYSVTINVNLKGESKKTTYTGCGSFVPDYGLDGKWKLEQLGNEKAIGTDFYGKIPVFTFDMEKLQFGGSSGCNMISGKIIMGPGKLRFDQFISTKMACKQGKEGELKQALDATRFYLLEVDKLTLKDENQQILLVFTKAE